MTPQDVTGVLFFNTTSPKATRPSPYKILKAAYEAALL